MKKNGLGNTRRI